MKTPAPWLPHRISSPGGVIFEFCSHGAIRRIDHGDIMINLFPGNELEGGPANIHLRLHGRETTSVPLLGPRSPSSFLFDDEGMCARGVWNDINYRLMLVPSRKAAAWFWHVELENAGSAEVSCDLILTQDTGLAHYGAVRLNEYYVSQYLDHTPLVHPRHGVAVATRQNQSMGGRCPWLLCGSLGRAVSFATDAMQFHGNATRAGKEPVGLASGLPGKRLQHEHAMPAIQEERLTLQPGERQQRGFFAWFEPDKPAATCEADADFIDRALALPEAEISEWPEVKENQAATSWFTAAPLLEAHEADEHVLAAFPVNERRHEEWGNGRLWSFFTQGGSHVVLKAKELAVLRPHGTLLRTGGALVPDESSLTSTAWMAGVFHSMVTQGHVSINRFISTCHGYLGLFRSYGQRVFMDAGDGWHLLDVPSVFVMSGDSCRWIYQHSRGTVEVLAKAENDPQRLSLEIMVTDGQPVRFLVSHHIAINGDDGNTPAPLQWVRTGDCAFIRPVADSDLGRRFPNGGFCVTATAETPLDAIGGDELLYVDGVPRGLPYLCMRTAPTRRAGLVIEGTLVEAAVAGERPIALPRIEPPENGSQAEAVNCIAAIHPWWVRDALVHYLSPRGLEQYSGGGWGTRDVCQGPVELLLAAGRFAPIRDLLCRVFRQQNPDGDWPQWFMFFDRERNIRPGDSHGDIVYWPLLALAQYLTATGDAALLDESLPFFHPDGDNAAEITDMRGHIERALAVIRRRVIPGTRLAAYGHGDWNDSLQPARPEMRDRLCSSWTVTLNYQTFTALAAAFRRLGENARAAEFHHSAAAILDEFQHTLIVDGAVAGLAWFHEDGKPEYLLHPRDGTTGLSYSLLPMIHAIINDMLDPQQAKAHLELIRKHLTGPDGAHLFDSPAAYRGGPQTNFQRAESASFFGREIGNMYMHAHLRYCEALSRHGDAESFLDALTLAVPINLRRHVPCAAPRQANCYYSSSDPAFADRYEALEQYGKVRSCEVRLEGGWRVYSSGAGIGSRLITQCLLGIRIEHDAWVIDPVIPAALDGLRARMEMDGSEIDIIYQIRGRGHGVESLHLNGTELPFTREPNRYRLGAACVALEDFRKARGNEDRLVISLG